MAQNQCQASESETKLCGGFPGLRNVARGWSIHRGWLSTSSRSVPPVKFSLMHRACKSPRYHFSLTNETEGLVLEANLLLFPAVPTPFLPFPSLFPPIALCALSSGSSRSQSWLRLRFNRVCGSRWVLEQLPERLIQIRASSQLCALDRIKRGWEGMNRDCFALFPSSCRAVWC